MVLLVPCTAHRQWPVAGAYLYLDDVVKTESYKSYLYIKKSRKYCNEKRDIHPGDASHNTISSTLAAVHMENRSLHKINQLYRFGVVLQGSDLSGINRFNRDKRW